MSLLIDVAISVFTHAYGCTGDGSTVAGSSAVSEAAAMEREQALALDQNLKKESIRASRLSHLLQESSLKDPPGVPQQREHICPYLAACERFKDHLVIKHSMIALGPENGVCFCQNCAAGKDLVQMTGSPPQQYILPVGWAQFIHRQDRFECTLIYNSFFLFCSSQTHALAQQCSKRWHVAYCCVPMSRVAGMMRTGQLVHAPDTGQVALSPDIHSACAISALPPHGYV